MPEVHEAADIGLIGGVAPKLPLGEVSEEAGAYSLGAFRDAARLLARGEIDGFCYGPLNKQALKLAGMPAEDEMRFLAAETRFAGPLGEINIGPDFWTSRVTSHVPIAEVAGLLSEERIASAAELLNGALARSGVAEPKIAIAALNPHAGDGGNFGTEEIRIIGPAVARVRARGIAATGPYPADTVFLAARKRVFDGVVTMYHDQGQIAMKLLGFDRGVTLHGGFPWPVTTPAHGTAFDIAGRGQASATAYRQALLLGSRMVRF